MRQKILKQVGVLLTVSILLTFLVVSLTMYSKFNGYMHDSVREEAEYIRVAIEETEGDYLNEKISSLKSDNRMVRCCTIRWKMHLPWETTVTARK